MLKVKEDTKVDLQQAMEYQTHQQASRIGYCLRLPSDKHKATSTGREMYGFGCNFRSKFRFVHPNLISA